MSVDGPSHKAMGTIKIINCKDIIVSYGPNPKPLSQEGLGPSITKVLGCEWDKGMVEAAVPSENKINPMGCDTPKKKNTKKWKRIARECPPRAMIGVCWNVRGLGNPFAFTALKRLLKKHFPDFDFLSETKIQGSYPEKLRRRLGFAGGISVDCRGKSEGLMLLWKDSLAVSVLSYSVEHINARMQLEDGFLFRFSGFYGNPVSGQ
ncbi:hypothetical protein Dsin_001916 [Dipteronia sinensis]|uniref:Uncharacterized protein n=1 Tax=Dipteronia sinensis TaxID=43782 RepID=A0AAE0EKR5_9ROSI|nr:hypothetical protein Dsin_001916 [Dipteronia sinensis]